MSRAGSKEERETMERAYEAGVVTDPSPEGFIAGPLEVITAELRVIAERAAKQSTDLGLTRLMLGHAIDLLRWSEDELEAAASALQEHVGDDTVRNARDQAARIRHFLTNQVTTLGDEE